MRASRLLPSLLLALAGTATPPAAAPDVHLPEGAARPPALERVELSPETRAFDVAPDGTRVAVATTHRAGKDARSILRVVPGAGQATEVELAGEILDLLFTPDGSEILVLKQQPATKKRAATSVLLRVDAAHLESRRETHLPASSRSLSYWAERHALLIVSQNEVRTLLLPGLRSGRLFRIPGDNRAVEVIGGSRALVGQAERLLWIDLDAPQGHDEMPLLAAIPVESPVVDLVRAADGSSGLARLADERVLRVRTAPLALEEIGRGWIWNRATRVGSTPAEAQHAVEPAPLEEPQEQEQEHEQEKVVVVVEPPAPAPSATAGAQLHGAISGPAAAAVIAVVFYGPSNILNEARRVVPRSDGRFEVSGLEDGRYRVVLDGGGSRVLVTEPAYHVVELRGAEPQPPLLFRVVRSL